MKSVLKHFLTVGILLFSFGAFAQMNPPKETSKEKKIDPVEITIKVLDKKLHLDDFQKAAIAVTLRDNQASIEQIVKGEGRIEEKMDKIQTVKNKIDKDILAVLNKEQTDTYLKLKEEKEKKEMKR